MPDGAAYALEAWHDLWVMVGGAAGALTGLVFVAVSINLDGIIGARELARRAAETVFTLLSILILAAVIVAPQPVGAVGIEVAVLGLVIMGIVVARLRQPRRHDVSVGFQLIPAFILIAYGLPLILGGVSLLAGAGGGLYWTLIATVLGFTGAVLNAWVLLVEIKR